MSAQAAAASVIARLREENETLAEQVTQLKRMLGATESFLFPPSLKLTPSEAKLFGLLMQREVVNRTVAMEAMYFDRPDDIPFDKIITVYICKVRKKLRWVGIELKCKWGEGYYLRQVDKERIKGMIEDERQQQAA